MSKASILIFALILSNFSFAEEIIRFDWDRSLHGHIAISIAHRSDDYLLSIFGNEGEFLYKLSVESEEVSKILRHADFCDFYIQESYVPRLQIDGSMWAILIQTEEQSHKVEYYSPKTGCVRDIGEMLISLSKLDIESRAIY